MTIDQLVTKLKGKTKGYPTDSSYPGECLSLVKLCLRDVYNIANPPPSGVNAAYGYWTNFPAPLPTKFIKIAYAKGKKPSKGDIVIWGTGIGKYGHIDIAYNNITTASFNGFDQNWGGKAAHIQNHNYNGVLGWLHPKGNIVGTMYRQKNENTVWLYYAGSRLPLTDPKQVEALGGWNKVRVVATLPNYANKCKECPPCPKPKECPPCPKPKECPPCPEVPAVPDEPVSISNPPASTDVNQKEIINIWIKLKEAWKKIKDYLNKPM